MNDSRRDLDEGAPDEGRPESPAILEQVRSFWDADAATYDRSRSHRPSSAAVLAAWTAALARLLPPAPARVLDAGAGTGFLSLIAARLGHAVTALDLSPLMLEQLERSARAESLEIETVVGPADRPPEGFDSVIERHLLWTLPDPVGALKAWREAAPSGRLVLLESVWGSVDRFEALRSRLRRLVRTARREPPDHHASYGEALRGALPLGSGTAPAELVGMVGTSGWIRPRLERLRDVEWSERCELSAIERVTGVSPRFAITAD
ncbi:MAG: class I SAM-dependent methyltransferase [Acidimicrobiales bacterium]